MVLPDLYLRDQIRKKSMAGNISGSSRQTVNNKQGKDKIKKGLAIYWDIR